MNASDAPEGFKAQLVAEWNSARLRLERAACEGKAAQKRWDEAVTAEMDAHRRMREFGAGPTD